MGKLAAVITKAKFKAGRQISLDEIEDIRGKKTHGPQVYIFESGEAKCV